MKKHSIYHHGAIGALCAAFAIAPLSASAQTPTPTAASDTAVYSDRDVSPDRRPGPGLIGLLGLLGLAGLLGRNRREVHEPTRSEVRQERNNP